MEEIKLISLVTFGLLMWLNGFLVRSAIESNRRKRK